jgi:hypothetical protein
MAHPKRTKSNKRGGLPIDVPESEPLWHLDFAEVTGHNLEARGREEVNRLLQAGWRLLHIYTLKYEEDGVWREPPMAILGRLREHAEPARSESTPPSDESPDQKKATASPVFAFDSAKQRLRKK